MKIFVLNLFAALAWMGLTGSFAGGGLLVGFALGYALLFCVRGLFGPTTYFEKPFRGILFLALYLADMVRSNLRVARDIVAIHRDSRPGVVAVPLDLKSDAEIYILASLVALTPGTMTLDVSKDRTVIYIHAMFVDHADGVRSEIKNRLERRVKELFR